VPDVSDLVLHQGRGDVQVFVRLRVHKHVAVGFLVEIFHFAPLEESIREVIGSAVAAFDHRALRQAFQGYLVIGPPVAPRDRQYLEDLPELFVDFDIHAFLEFVDFHGSLARLRGMFAPRRRAGRRGIPERL